MLRFPCGPTGVRTRTSFSEGGSRYCRFRIQSGQRTRPTPTTRRTRRLLNRRPTLLRWEVSRLPTTRLNFLNTGELRTSGNAGFGTVAPNTRLTLSGGPQWTSNGWTASMNMQNASALGWEPNGSGQRFGIGQTNGGLYFFRTISGFGSTLTPAQVDLQITDNGDVAQPMERNGVVKAMVAVTASGAIARCYNGVSGSSNGNCGIVITSQPTAGLFYVDFPFQVSNRFWLVTSVADFQLNSDFTAHVDPTATSTRLAILTRRNGNLEFLPFHLFVF